MIMFVVALRDMEGLMLTKLAILFGLSFIMLVVHENCDEYCVNLSFTGSTIIKIIIYSFTE